MEHPSQETEQRSTLVPVWILVILGLVMATAVGMLYLGASSVGATWDERIHAVMLGEYFTSGWYASPDWLVNGAPEAFLGKWPYYVYAPVSELITQGFAVLTGAEPWKGFSESTAAYTARHLATGLIALLGILGTGLITRLVTRSWRWGVVGAAFIATTPMWIGHGMFNVKDLPVGTGYTFATLAFVALCRTNYPRSWRSSALSILSLVGGIALAVGTRPASGLPIAMTGISLILGAGVYLVIFRASPTAFPKLGRRIRDLAIGFIAAYLLLVVIYPKGFINPYTLAKESLLISGRFPVNDMVLTNGTWLSQPPPWFYLPTWFGAQLTLIVLVFLVIFVVLWLLLVVRTLAARRAVTASAVESVLLPMPVLLQAFLLPLLAILVHSTMYNAVRQFLFVVPAVAVLAALGIKATLELLHGDGKPRQTARLAIWVIVAIGVIAPTVDQIRLFPYNYVYFNEVATLQPINGRWATDYWRASSQELTTIIPSTGDESCSYVTLKKGIQPCGEQSPFIPYWGMRGEAAVPGQLDQSEYWLVRENGGDVNMPPGCTLHDQLVRPLHGQELIIAQVLKCQLPLGPT